VRTGQFSDPAAAQHLAGVLIKRRDSIGRAYLTAINPVVAPALSASGSLSFGNAAVDGGFAESPSAYKAVWFRFDNDSGRTELLGESGGATTTLAGPLLPTALDTFVAVDISGEADAHPSWRTPVRAFFRRDVSGWTLVGLDRLPAGDAPAARWPGTGAP
jgi:hypothetical protein